ncbi:hypothetical protein MUG78_17400 [Gordonia alkaliphila]|uniref:hypothetical protein n=1 Tax=Gordonia alkaliphila TaxID=1053547 RepID=UPI001FF2942D|nr:hypothetical protein [Gordonia alkaliphila]MCK0441178.1 hypothetical protein [Gordonia alkaliphila]
MPEKPFTIGEKTIMNIPAEDLLDMCSLRGADVLVAPGQQAKKPGRDLDTAREAVKVGGLLIAMTSRTRGLSTYVETVADEGHPNALTRITLPRTRKHVRSVDGGGTVTMERLRELFADVPNGAKVVGLTSCGGALLVLAVERDFKLVCTEPDVHEFMCAVANVGRQLDYRPIDEIVAEPSANGQEQ